MKLTDDSLHNVMERMEKLSDDATVWKTKDGPLIYFAGPWFTKKDRIVLTHIKKITERMEMQGRNKYLVYFPDSYHSPSPKDCYDRNVEMINKCNIVVAYISTKDVGTAWEIGMAKALNKRIIFLVYDEDDMKSKTNIMLAFASEAVITVNDYQNFIEGNEMAITPLQFENSWEDKE